MLSKKICVVVNRDKMDKINNSKGLKIMIVEDEEDILVLYRDYLSGQGHNVAFCYLSADNILTYFDEILPDICLMDYRLHGKMNGIDAAIEILNKYPSMPILFITAHEPLGRELSNYPIFQHKNIQVLVKPVKLNEIENSLLKIVKINK